MQKNFRSEYEIQRILEINFPNCVYQRNGDNFYTVILINQNCLIIDLNTLEFATPTFSKLTEFIEIDGLRLASFEIELPYKTDKMDPTNYLYGVVDHMGNVYGQVVNFRTKEEYIVGKFSENEKISNEGIKIHNFNNLLIELSKAEADLYVEQKKEQKSYLKKHEEPMFSRI